MPKTVLSLLETEEGERDLAVLPAASKRGRRAPAVVPLEDIQEGITGWLLDAEIRQCSPATLALRRTITTNLVWFLQRHSYPACGLRELRQFLAYVAHGDPDEEGRWGRAHLRRLAKPRTVQVYHQVLGALFAAMVADGTIAASPLDGIERPIDRPDDVQPFSADQVAALLAAARKSRYPMRDETILLLLLDTGMRASELCGLRVSDVDVQGRRMLVEGKGGKRRELPLCPTTARAVWRYLRATPRKEGDWLFIARRGPGVGGPMTRNGLKQLVVRLGAAAGVHAVRCSPHTFRHTFATEFLRGGGQPGTLQRMLGHTSMRMTMRYVAFTEADVRAQHAQFSPVERLLGSKRGK